MYQSWDEGDQMNPATEWTEDLASKTKFLMAEHRAAYIGVARALSNPEESLARMNEIIRLDEVGMTINGKDDNSYPEAYSAIETMLLMKWLNDTMPNPKEITMTYKERQLITNQHDAILLRFVDHIIAWSFDKLLNRNYIGLPAHIIMAFPRRLVKKNQFEHNANTSGFRTNIKIALDKDNRSYGIPGGVAVRRMLAFYYQKFYENMFDQIHLDQSFCKMLGYKKHYPGHEEEFKKLQTVTIRSIPQSDHVSLHRLVVQKADPFKVLPMKPLEWNVCDFGNGRMTLSPFLAYYLVRNPLFIDLESVMKLGGNPVRVDVYVFLADLLHRIPENTTLKLSFKDLARAFGRVGSNTVVNKFRSDFKDAIRVITDEKKGVYKVGGCVKSNLHNVAFKYHEPPVTKYSHYSYFRKYYSWS